MDSYGLPSWDLKGKYTLLKRLGKGTYGSVCEARSNLTGNIVAIKSLKGIFENIYDAKRILREICIMHILDHPHVVKIIEVLVTEKSFRTIYIVMESAQTDLKKIVKSPTFLDPDQVRYMFYQAVCGLQYIHSANILHRDLKPANLLINEDCTIKICDFGLSRSYLKVNQFEAYVSNPSDSMNTNQMGMRSLPMDRQGNSVSKRDLTVHVVTRWYRAPEIILLEKDYNKAIDIWSLGCVFAEMLSMVKANAPHFIERGPLFPGQSCFPLSPDMYGNKRPGHPCTEYDQLNLIFNLIGTPCDEDLKSIEDPKAREYVASFPPRTGQSILDYLPGCSVHEVDILAKMLTFNPKRRILLNDLIAHPYFDSVRDPSKEVLANVRAHFIFDSNVQMDVETLREIFCKVIGLEVPSN